ncbi:MAG: hypothetical protein A3C07_00510 [Candidatus Sungbacteria bacterium RIFCSPHIGHO2_02_FULL_47_11]|uniref:Pilus assembly protein PilO n=1 Tax=Candidatus Sungbacteria bacterium RIFCSPHIGHO2_02_FULL_47_11 TaxID=1802270 RepID=A0A1G2KQK7_9BACT|nr:MAG: hypothetical protein A3C07_00510 [Candidatus Sungbacteria bacterium RIFCSPHIGHO2_02_FULL_47_11]
MSRIIATILFLIGALAVGIIYLAPQWDRFKSLRTEIDSLEAMSAELDELVKKRDILFDSVNALPRNQLAQISQAVPLGTQSSELLVVLETLAADHNVALKSIDIAVSSAPATPQLVAIGQPVPGGLSPASLFDDSIRELPITLNLTGSYESLKNFLRDLEQSIRIIDVVDISFGSVEKGGLINFSVRAKTYYQ